MVSNGFYAYTRSLASVDFSAAVFTYAHFQRVAQISSICDFHNINEGIPSFLRFSVTNDIVAADMVHEDFCQI